MDTHKQIKRAKKDHPHVLTIRGTHYTSRTTIGTQFRGYNGVPVKEQLEVLNH